MAVRPSSGFEASLLIQIPPPFKRRWALHRRCQPQAPPGELPGRSSPGLGGSASSSPPSGQFALALAAAPGRLGAATFPPSLPPLQGGRQTPAPGSRCYGSDRRPPRHHGAPRALHSPAPGQLPRASSLGGAAPVAPQPPPTSQRGTSPRLASQDKWRGGRPPHLYFLADAGRHGAGRSPRVPLWFLLGAAAPHHGALRRRPRPARSRARRPLPSPGASILKNRAVTPPPAPPHAPPQVEAASDAMALRVGLRDAAHAQGAACPFPRQPLRRVRYGGFGGR